MRWEYKGIFSLELPEDWSVVEGQDGIIEVRPATANGTVHFSVLKRDIGGPVKPGEASSVVVYFAQGQGAADVAVSEREVPGGRAAHAAFETRRDNLRLAWEVEARVWPERAIRCSLCYDGDDRNLRKLALALFESVRPDTAAA